MFDNNAEEEQQFDGTGGSTGGMTMEQMIN